MSEHTPTAQDALREIAKFEGDVKYAWLLQEAANKLDANADLLRINELLVRVVEDLIARLDALEHPHRCEICKDDFINSDALWLHSRTKHQVTP